MQTFNANDVLTMLRGHISYEQSQKDLATEIGVSGAFLCAVLKGKKRPSKKVLSFLGLQEVKLVVYKRATARR